MISYKCVTALSSHYLHPLDKLNGWKMISFYQSQVSKELYSSNSDIMQDDTRANAVKFLLESVYFVKKHEHSELHRLKAEDWEEGAKAAGSMVNKSMSLHRIQRWLFRLGEIIKRFWGGQEGGKERLVTEKWAPSFPPPLRSDLHFPAHCSTSHHVRLFHALPPKPNPPGTYGLAKDVLTRPETFMVMRLVWSKNSTGSTISFLSNKKLLFLPKQNRRQLGFS